MTWVAIDPDGRAVAAVAGETVHLWDSGGARAGVIRLLASAIGLAVTGDR